MASTAILDATGTPIRPQSSPVQFRDTVTEAIAFGCNASTFGRQNGLMERMFAPQMAAAAYLTSGMLQKVIDIPASDRIREWRDWQGADKEQVDAIEAEERRLQIQAKFRFCEVLRGTGGGALILVAAGNPAEDLRPETIRDGGLIAVNIARRTEITPEDFDRELSSPTYGEPRRWRVNTTSGSVTYLHPSRVIAFRGDPYPSSVGISLEDQFWGLSRLVRVYREVMKSDNAQAWFADLVRKAKLLRIGIPGLTDYTATDDGQARLNRRMAAVAMSENGLNATVYDAGGINQPGETITDYQVSWAGIPAVMDAFDQRVAAVADIPFTRLMGRSPAGMNATGAHDEANYNAMVAAGQTLEVAPCLDRLDAVLLRSAGVDPKGLWYRFSPLSKPSPTEEATRFKTTADALKTIADARVMPERAFAAGAQSTIEENGWMPGAIPELAKMSEDERFGLDPAYDPSLGDPSALDPQLARGGDPGLGGSGGTGGSGPAGRSNGGAA